MPKPRNQVEDTKSAIRFIRQHAGKLGVAPERIVATGTSGGGDRALQSYLNRAFEDPQDDKSVSHRPNALVLYCPAFDGIDICYVKSETLLERTKRDAREGDVGSFSSLRDTRSRGRRRGMSPNPTVHRPRTACIKLCRAREHLDHCASNWLLRPRARMLMCVSKIRK